MAGHGPPDVVLVIADDLGIGDIGAYGSRSVRTRTCNRLAENGVRFDAMYTPGSTDTPARAGALTGRYGARYGLPASVSPGAPDGLPAAVPTVAAALHDAGYATGCFGQWRLGSGPGQHPLDRGFDAFSGTLYGTDATPLAWYEQRTEADPTTDIGLAARRMSEAAAAFAHAVPGRTPLFAVVSHLGPHFPYEPDPRYVGNSGAGRYGDTVETIDRTLEWLLTELRRAGRDDNTLVIVTSDNGPRYEGSTQRRRGRKPEVMDGGVRVPFIAAWLDRRMGTVDDTPRSLLDLTPTLCALAGAQAPADLDGEDMSALLTQDGPAPRGPVYLFFDQYLNAVRSGPWKLHYRYGADSRTYMPQLFDLSADPREAFNVAETHPDVVDRLLPGLLALREEVAAEARQHTSGGGA